LSWRLAIVVEIVTETQLVHSIVLDVADWPGHKAGQHVDVRLTAPDGYQAQRSYSIASAPGDGYLVITVAVVPNGEVSSYLVSELMIGDELEIRGPLGGYFVWDDHSTASVLMVAGGSGIVPFRSMLRHCVGSEAPIPVRLLYSARTLEAVIYRDELMRLAAYDELDVRLVLSREWPAGWLGPRGRVTPALLLEAAWPADATPINFVCGPSGFVETAANALAAQGHAPNRIRTERFGP
jgi:ferredoxin-NADP reductase